MISVGKQLMRSALTAYFSVSFIHAALWINTFSGSSGHTVIHLARALKQISTICSYFKQYLNSVFQVGKDIVCMLFNPM